MGPSFSYPSSQSQLTVLYFLLCLFLPQVLESRTAEKGAWPESPAMGGHMQVFMVEDAVAGSTALSGGE